MPGLLRDPGLLVIGSHNWPPAASRHIAQLAVSRPLSGPHSKASRIVSGVVPFNRSASTYRDGARMSTNRPSSLAISTRWPSQPHLGHDLVGQAQGQVMAA